MDRDPMACCERLWRLHWVAAPKFDRLSPLHQGEVPHAGVESLV
jgi:hypothetical protein